MKRFPILCLAVYGCCPEPVLPPTPSVQEQESALDEQDQIPEPIIFPDLDWVDQLIDEIGGQDLLDAQTSVRYRCLEISTGLKFTGDDLEETTGLAWSVKARARGGNEHTRKCDALLLAMTEDEVMAAADRLAKSAEQ